MEKRVFAQIDKLNDAYVDIWEDVCNIESPSTNKEAVDRVGASDASNVASAGIPCLDSLGVEGEKAHTIYEYGIISSPAESAKRVAAVICGI